MRPKTVHRRLRQRVRHIESVWGRGRLVRLSAVMLMTLSLLIPTLTELHQQQMYTLDASTIRLVGKANKNLVKKFSYDAQHSVWQFNKSGIKPDLSNLKDPNEVAAQLKAQVGGGGKGDTSLYSVDLPTDATKGVTYYDNNTGLSFGLVPQFKVSDGQERDGRLVYPFQDGGKLVYTAMNNGMKEDIVLSHNIGDKLTYSYKLSLPKTLEARLLDDGSLGIYSADPALFGNITYGSDVDQAKIERARQTATKDHLLFALPAPVVKQTGSNTNAATAHFALQDDELFVSATGLNKLNYPVTIDPSVVVTSSSDFGSGNNEGNIDFNTDQINRGGLTGGSAVAGWTAGTSFVNGRYGHQVVTYNGYLYVLGGYTNTGNVYFNDVQYAPLNSDGSVGTWQGTTSFAVARQYHTSVAYNGYMYVMGGWNGSTYYSDVQYAPIKNDGSLGSWSYTKALTSARRGHTAVAYNGYMYVMGGYTGSLLNIVQYAAIHGDGTLSDWITTYSFTNGRNSHTSAAYNGYLYILGGWPGSYTNDVQYARINSDGSIDPWKTTTSLPTVIANHATTVYNGYIYVTGGTSDGTTYFKTVYYAQINTNGTLGSWQRTTDLPAVRNIHAMVSYNGYLYIAGGLGADYFADSLYAKIDPPGATSRYTATTSFTNVRLSHTTVAYNGYMYVLGGDSGGRKLGLFNDVQYAPINSDGTVGTWTATTSFTNARYGHTTVAYNGYLYVLGGFDDTNYFNDVQYAPINSDGTVGTWTATTSFTNARLKHTTVAYNGYLYVLGGFDGNDLSDVQYAPINSDGTVGTWTATTSFTNARSQHTTVAYNGYLYVLGGCGSSGGPVSCYNDTLYARINNGGSGTTGTWTTSTNNLSGVYPSGLAYERVVANNNYIYSVGGYDGIASSNKVYYASVGTDGSVGAWTATNSLITARYSIGTVVHNGYIYVFGGQTSGATRVNSVEYATINSDGTLGPWSTSSYTFANARSQLRAETYNGYVYVFGGEDASVKYSDVRYAKFGAGGELAANAGCGTAWCSANSFTTSRTSFGSGVYSGYLYVIGGNTGSTLLSDVQYAPINADGTLGNWSYTTSLPIPLYAMEASVANGFIYVYGGVNSISRYTNIYFSPIAPNGGLGGWDTAINQFATKRDSLAGTIYNGTLYIVGGYTSTGYLSDVQYAPLDVLPRIGHYSKLIDLGEESILDSITYNGTLPGGAKSITYRTASSDGIFGAPATIDTIVGGGGGGGACGSGGGTVHYIWISVTIDDSAEDVVFPNITGTTSNLTDITVNYTPNDGRASPDRRLHNGKFFKNEVLQPLDTCVE